MTEEIKLTRKQQLFIDYYLQSFNASDAARKAGYSEKTAYAMGWENLRKPEIQAEIQARLEEVHMSAEEAVKLQSDIARGDISEFLSPMGIIDVDRLREGRGRLVKKIRQRTVTKIGKKETDEDVEITDIELELYPADAAQERILKLLGKFTDRVDVTSGGEKLVVEIVKASDAKGTVSDK